MTTYTVLISIPDEEAPACPADLAKLVHCALEEGHGAAPGFTVATVDATAGDRISLSFPMEVFRRAHARVAGDDYAGPRRFADTPKSRAKEKLAALQATR